MTLETCPYRRRRLGRRSEAAWQLAQAGVPVTLHEMRPQRQTAAHKTDGFAETGLFELIPLRRQGPQRRGLLHAEMRRLGSLIMRAADQNQVPAGGAWRWTVTVFPLRSRRR